MARRNGGFVGQDGLDAPDPPTGVVVSGGADGVASISFTAPSDTGTSAITGFVATASTGVGATATSSPISVTGLTLGTAATFRAYAVNAYGTSAASDATSSLTPSASRGIFSGGENNSGANINRIDFISIATTGNATDFGDTSVGHAGGAGVSSSTRGVIQLGQTASGRSNALEYITISTQGNTTDFGDTSVTRSSLCGNANSTRGLFYTGTTGQPSNVVDYITIASTGDATDFGDASLANASSFNGVTCNGTRALFAIGSAGDAGNPNTIEYFTVASTGNATDFGDRTVSKHSGAAVCSTTRGVFAGGDSDNVIDFVTIASTGNATDFGDLNNNLAGKAGVCNSTRGCIGGGTGRNDIDYITIASAGNATDFGDLTVAPYLIAGGISNAHGGIA